MNSGETHLDQDFGLLVDYEGGELPAPEVKILEQRLSDEPELSKRLAWLRSLRAELGEFPTQPVPRHFTLGPEYDLKGHFPKDYYAVLEVSPDASQKEIRNQYLFLLQAWHPDRFANTSHKARAEQKAKEINEAYEVLSDEEKRQAYDRDRPSYKEHAFRTEYDERRRAEEEMRKQAEKEAARKRAEDEHPCPFCAESIHVDSVVCHYCGSTLVVRDHIYKRSSSDLGLRWALVFSAFDFAFTYSSGYFTAPQVLGGLIAKFVIAFTISYYASRFHRKRKWKPALEWLSIAGTLIISRIGWSIINAGPV